MKRQGESFLSSLPMRSQRKGQFYLVTTIMIITIILGFVSLTNFVQKRSTLKFYYDGEELALESERVLDYILSNKATVHPDTQIGDFIENFTEYSEAENFYFLYNSSDSILKFKGYKRLESGNVTIKTESEELLISLNKGEFGDVTHLSNPGSNIKMTIHEGGDDLVFDFVFNGKTNFYYVISREIGGDRYLETNA